MPPSRLFTNLGANHAQFKFFQTFFCTYVLTATAFTASLLFTGYQMPLHHLKLAIATGQAGLHGKLPSKKAGLKKLV